MLECRFVWRAMQLRAPSTDATAGLACGLPGYERYRGRDFEGGSELMTLVDLRGLDASGRHSPRRRFPVQRVVVVLVATLALSVLPQPVRAIALVPWCLGTLCVAWASLTYSRLK